MKKLLLGILILIACAKISQAQQAPPNWMWLDGSGGSNYQYGCGIGTDDSGYHYISGRFDGTITFPGSSGNVSLTNSGFNVATFVGKFDENGLCKWLSFHDYGWDYPRGFCTDKAKNNNEYVTGNINSGDGMFVMKYDHLGNLLWDPTLGTGSFYGYGGSPNGDGVAADTAGNVYVTGETGDAGYAFGDSTITPINNNTTTTWPQDQEMFLTKMDNSGNFLWAVGAEGIDLANAGYDVGRGVVLDKTGQYVFVCGGYQDSVVFHSKYSSGDIIPAPAATGTSSFFVAKYDTAGNLLFVASATNAGIPWISGFNSGVGAVNAVAVDSCDNIFVTGYYTGTAQFGTFTLTASNTGGQPDGFVASCSSKGQWQWVMDIGSSSSSAGDYGQDIALDKDNDVYVGGTINGTATFGNGVSATASSVQGSLFLAKYANSNGAVQWAQTSVGSSQSGVAGLAIDTQKFVYIDGSFNGILTLGGNTVTASTNEGNIFIAKLDTVQALYIVPMVDSAYCAGATVSLPYNVTGTFNNGNTFTAQLSDSTGSFVNAVNIGSVNSTSNGTITITIPAGTTPGSMYLIRVVSSNPAGSSYVNGCGAYYQKNVYINNFYVTIGNTLSPSILASDTSICSGGTVKLIASGGTTYSWNNGASGDSIVIKPTIDSVYVVTVGSGGCSGKDSIHISVNQAAPLASSTQNVCAGSGVLLTVPASGSNYTWAPDSTLNTYTGDTVTASPTANTIYTVTGLDSLGCTVTGNDTVDIIYGPNKPTITISVTGDSLVSSAGSYNQWYFNGSPIDSTRQVLVIKGHARGWYTVTVINPANGCGTTSDSTTSINQLLVMSNELSIYPNPFNSNIFVKINSSASGINGWSLQLTDVLGRTIYTDPSLNYSNEIDLSGLPNGVYFITVTDKTTRAVFPVVKQN